MSEQIVYYKKHKTVRSEYYYYVTKKDNRYYVYVEVVDHIPVTPTWTVDRYGGKECLTINEREAKEVIELLKRGKYEQFEENYGNRDWIVEW